VTCDGYFVCSWLVSVGKVISPAPAWTVDVRRALVASGIVSKTDPAALSRWCRQLTPVCFPPGHVIATGGDIGGRLYVIMSGKVKASICRSDDHEVALVVLGRHEIFGVVSLFDPVASETRITALTEVVSVPIERDQLLSWMAECPELGARTLRLFARRAREMTDALTDFASADVQGRVASRLSLLKRRFGRREGEVVRIEHDMTLEDFSRLVGASPQLIRSTLRDFENRGWIRLEDGSVVIVDFQAFSSVR
jgi:CRP/FNR family transcriptional regulator, cyclic AMP receptor protein